MVIAYNNLGDALYMTNQIDKAINCYKTVIDLDPKSSNAHNNLGTAFKLKNNLDQARKCYLTAIELNPRNNIAFNNLAGVYHTLKQTES